jgi:glyoxylase-like metal-dependent hydrolase (beta-lactamase superfamily II)
MIHLIDGLHLGTPHVVCVALVECGPDELLLVDTGPETVFDTVVGAIRTLGFQPANVRHLLASHIHLDHSGGAWRWAKEFGTHVYVHPKGAPHLIDPSKLISSATRIYGDKLEFLWGKVEPIAEAQVISVDDGTHLKFGREEFDVLYTPGHAQHHNAYWLKSEQTVFAGDVAGVRIPGGPTTPPCPPPDIHLELWKESLEKIRALKPVSLHLTHFGRVDQPLEAIDALEERLFSWADWIRKRMSEGKSEAQITPEFEQFTHQQLVQAGTPHELLAIYEQADPAYMSVAGLIRYWRKFHLDSL